MSKGPEETFFQRRYTNGRQVREKMFSITSHQGSAKTMRQHPTPVRTSIIKKARDNKCWSGCGEYETLVHCWWDL